MWIDCRSGLPLKCNVARGGSADRMTTLPGPNWELLVIAGEKTEKTEETHGVSPEKPGIRSISAFWVYYASESTEHLSTWSSLSQQAHCNHN
ncbi:hypothetical protein N7522_011996 [Penicillium canescens]|uniref:Uncharacterized protein n=1 Tax=Penicillium canescens TaxID=5083 RepID=A0AAD6N2X4_PENCN|nr:uncharacterized protein N7446_013955 [Penicillium canescens]KAJ5984800.1 hypothetical protein N7522_011996 [Penicillium canescens]KAJ6023591.1 hypothetical protein N7460_013986 [Penicillium canescens]KAJ6025131.1 hypothetical protein N7444_012810 [Penicillium canescens]KAJ6042889.1 hypothetical protein N7446_013955 [Penicillium canescens]